MKVTYLGHACFGVEVGGSRLLFDPFITPNPLAKNIDLGTVPADYILISHGHGDHIADAVALAKRTAATVICNYEISVWLGNQGVANCHPLNHGGGSGFPFGRVKFVSAIHSSGLPDGTYGGNPGGFVIESREGNFYYSGDTALSLDMKLIGETTPLKFAVLCIGDTFTMGPEDAARAAQFIRCRQILGVHYDTFPPIQIDHQAAVNAFRQAGANLILLPIGQSHQFD